MKILFCILSILFTFTQITSASVTSETTRLQEAEQAIQQAIILKTNQKENLQELRKAERRYLNHVHAGYYNWAVCYNLGTIYYEMKDFGNSILWLRRAEALNPTNEDIHHNLKLVQQTINKPSSTLSGLERLYIMITSIFSPEVLFLILLSTLSFLPILLLFIKKDKQIIHFLLLSDILVILLIGSTCILEWNFCYNNNHAVIIKNNTQGYRGPGSIHAKAFTTPLAAGTESIILDQQNNWFKVRFNDGSTTWIEADRLGLQGEFLGRKTNAK